MLSAAAREAEVLCDLNGEVRTLEVFQTLSDLTSKWDQLHDNIIKLHAEAKTKQAELQERKAKILKLTNWVNGQEVNCDDLKMQSTDELETYLARCVFLKLIASILAHF